MVRRGNSMLLALLCLLPCAPAQAGPLDPPPMLVISGSGPTVATFTLRDEIEINYLDSEATYTGRYGGVLIEPVRGRGRGGVVWMAALASVIVPPPAGREPPTPLGPSTQLLPPGAYRAYLLADKDAEVRLPLRTGDTALTVRTTRKVRQVFVADHRDFEPGQTSVTLRAPVTVGKRAVFVNVGQYSGWLTEDLDLLVCLARRGKPCDRRHDPFGTIKGDQPYGVQVSIDSDLRGVFPPGSRDVLLTASITSTVKATVTYGYVEVDLL